MAQEKPSIVSTLLSGAGGKTKTNQAASAKNQQLAKSIAAKELGVDPSVPLTKQAFEDVRANASKAYGAVSQAMPETSTDLTFASTVKQLGNRATKAAQEFPSLFKNAGIDDLVADLSKDKFDTAATMFALRQLRTDAATNLKAFDDPAKLALGKTQWDAAKAVEDLIERRLSQQGNKTLMQNFRQARQLIAKSHDIENATNLATGDVSLSDFARMADRGRPLTGGLAALAKMGAAFPKASQDVAKFGGVEGIGVLDLASAAMGGGAAVASDDPRWAALGAAVPIARALSRGTVLSNPYQNAIIGGGGANVARGASGIDPRLLGIMSPVLLQRYLSQSPGQPR